MLSDLDAELCAAVAYLLGWFPEEAEGSIPVLLDLLESEVVAGVTANALISIDLLTTGFGHQNIGVPDDGVPVKMDPSAPLWRPVS